MPMPQALIELKQISQEENWEYRFAESSRDHPFLYNYLHYTFSRLLDENKIATTKDDTWACFNTGLITDNYEEVFAVFELNRSAHSAGPKWYFKSFCRESDRLLLKFGSLPDIAHYFDDPAELLFDTRCSLRKNIDHIIEDNRSRFPEPFASMEDGHQLRIALEGASITQSNE